MSQITPNKWQTTLGMRSAICLNMTNPPKPNISREEALKELRKDESRVILPAGGGNGGAKQTVLHKAQDLLAQRDTYRFYNSRPWQQT